MANDDSVLIPTEVDDEEFTVVYKKRPRSCIPDDLEEYYATALDAYSEKNATLSWAVKDMRTWIARATRHMEEPRATQTREWLAVTATRAYDLAVGHRKEIAKLMRGRGHGRT